MRTLKRSVVLAIMIVLLKALSRLHGSEPLQNVFHQMKPRRIGEAIVSELALGTEHDRSKIPQLAENLRGTRHRDSQHLAKVANAELTALKSHQHA